MITPDGGFKSFDDMTRQERRRDMLRHFPTLLARWRGANAQLWELTISIKTLRIRLERSGVQGNLQVACVGPTYIHGPVYWEDCDLEVVLAEDESFIVRDVRAGLEIHAALVEMAENRNPVQTRETLASNSIGLES